MKRHLVWIGLILLIGFASSEFALASKKSLRSNVKKTFWNHDKVWLGVASDAFVLASSNVALTGILGVSEKAVIQTYGLLRSVDPFLFSLGANYKVTLLGNLKKGLHVGGGFGIGTFGTGQGATSGTDLFFRLNAIGGFHFHFLNRILVGIDAGLTANVTGGDFDLFLGGHSRWLGLTLAYRI